MRVTWTLFIIGETEENLKLLKMDENLLINSKVFFMRRNRTIL